MKKISTLIAIIVLAGLGWWLASPLFIDKQVEEDFPIVTSDQALVGIVDPMITHDLNQEKIDTMTEGERMEMEEEIVKEFSGQPDTTMNESLPEEVIDSSPGNLKNDPGLIKQGSFIDGDGFHKGSGFAKIYGWGEGSEMLRLESFSVTNGPDLRVYLTKELNPTKEQVKAGLEVAELKGNKGNQNYELPFEVDPTDYNAVVIYCKPFGVIFSVATLN